MQRIKSQLQVRPQIPNCMWVANRRAHTVAVPLLHDRHAIWAVLCDELHLRDRQRRGRDIADSDQATAGVRVDGEGGGVECACVCVC
jgi:hypothetical protein